MADYWVSQNRYFCKYCKIYIADEINQRRQHDEGLRHKGNVDRYIKDLYKRGAQEKKDKADHEREMKRIEQAAHAAMGTHPAPVASTSGEPAAKKPRASFAPSLSSYSSAASLGLAPEEDEPFYLPGQRRPDQGEAGEWQTVSRPAQADAPVEQSEEPLYRQLEQEAEEAPSYRTLKERTAFLDDDLYDPGAIKLKRKPGEARVKKEEETEAAPRERATFRPIRFGQPTEVKQEEEKPAQEALAAAPAAVPVDEAPVKVEEPDVKPVIAADEPGPSLFKKRKRKGAQA